MLQGIEPGELGKWLRVVQANSQPGAHQQGIPSNFAEHLVNLRVARLDENGRLVITDKGRLAVRMEAPDALHKQVDPDDVAAQTQDEEGVEEASSKKGAGHAHPEQAPYDGEDDEHDDCGPGCGHHHHR